MTHHDPHITVTRWLARMRRKLALGLVVFAGEAVVAQPTPPIERGWPMGAGEDIRLSPDGGFAVIRTLQDYHHVWRTADATWLRTLPAGRAAFSPRGVELAVATLRSGTSVFHTSDWSVIRELPGVTGGSPFYSPDGCEIATAGAMLRVFDSVSGIVLRATENPYGANLVGWTADGILLGFSRSGAFVAWNAHDLSLRYVNADAPEQPEIPTAVLSPDGRWLALILFAGAECGRSLELRSAATGKLVGQYPTCAHGIAFAPDSQSAYVSSADDNGIREVTVPQLAPIRNVTAGYPRGAHGSFVVDHDGASLIFAGPGVPRLRLSDGVVTRPGPVPAGNRATNVVFAGSGRLAADFSGDIFATFDPSSGATAIQHIIGQSDGPADFGVSTDSERLLLRWEDIVQAVSGFEEEWRVDDGDCHNGRLYLLPGDHSFIDIGCRVRERRVADGALLREFEPSPGDGVGRAGAMSPDGLFVAQGHDNVVDVWRVSDGARIATAPIRLGSGQYVELTPGATHLLTTGYAAIGVYSLPDGKYVQEIATPNVRDSALSPDGRTIAVTMRDGGLRCLALCDGSLIADYQGIEFIGPSVPEFSRDSRFLALGRIDGTILLLRNPATRPGDVNCDARIDFFDIEPFLLALFDPAAYAAALPDCNLLTADTNGDGQVNFFDIDSFVALLFP